MSDLAISYSSLIEEAFIKPIRNVTVIDDEYPTLLSLIDIQFSDTGKESPDLYAYNSINVERLKRIIKMCHNSYKWGIDVFSGRLPDIDINLVPPHIHHSDLIVLDYHLDGEATNDDGSRARRIIKSLEENNHYNQILVHTKGYAGDIKNVYIEILKDLIPMGHDEPLRPEVSVVEKMNTWLDDNDDGNDYHWINCQFELLSFLEFFSEKNKVEWFNVGNPHHIMHTFLPEINAISHLTQIEVVDLIKWKYLELINKECEFRKSTRNDFEWGWDDETNFISTGKTFITVIKKSTDDPDDELIGSLKVALKKRNASPMHLLMAKMRFELDEKGIEQACNIINNKHAQAGWLYNLLQNSDSDSAHDKAINLHWEQLATASRLELRDFSKKIVMAANCSNASENSLFVKKFFRECMIDKELTLGMLNAYSCSMDVSNNHLRTGTVIDLESEIWVCVTPACDMVPGQRIKQWESRIGSSFLAFKAVKLEPASLKEANKKANYNNHIFLNVNNAPLAFTLGSDNIIWDTFFATKQGCYEDGKSISLYVAREEDREDNKLLNMKKIEAKAIAELRYEYALNILHKFSASQSRVGLDFQDIRSMWS